MGNADIKRSFSAASGASSLSKQLVLPEQTKAPSRQQSGNCTENVAAVPMSREGQSCPCRAAVTTAAWGCCRRQEKMLTLFGGMPLTSQQRRKRWIYSGEHLWHHNRHRSRSFLCKFEAHPGFSAGVFYTHKKQDLEQLNLMTQQFYKWLGCVEQESGVLTRPHEQSKPQPLGHAVYSKNKFLTAFFWSTRVVTGLKQKAIQAFPLTCKNAIIHSKKCISLMSSTSPFPIKWQIIVRNENNIKFLMKTSTKHVKM